MIHLLHGPNAYLSKKNLTQLTQKFQQKFGFESVVFFDGTAVALDDILTAANSIPMFTSEKLIVVKHFSENREFNNSSEKFEKIDVASINLIFWENSKVDGRSSFFKFIQKHGKVEKFDSLKGMKLRQWIVMEFSRRDKRIRLADVNLLLERVGEEMWRLNGEIEKLSLYSSDKTIRAADILECVSLSAQIEIWELTDAIGSGDKQQALKVFERLIKQGEDPFYIFSMIIWQFRRLVLVESMLQQRLDRTIISTKLKLHPFAARKLFAQSGRISVEKLKIFYSKLVEIDFGIKTSKFTPEFAISLLLSSI